MAGDRAIHVGGSVTGSSLVTGDGNTVTTTTSKVTLPPPESVDIRAELAAIRALLQALPSEHNTKIKNALAEAEEEAAKPQPDKDEIGKAITRATDYAKKTTGFAEALGNLTPHLVRAASWLGTNGMVLLKAVGLAG